ncbi:DNA-binding transcriptional regulator RstA [Klebsiella michiganensis]|nr:DNA-binding transcriptional regulator RstA [Klebsiella michiganensis]
MNRQVMLGGESVALSTADFDLLWELATHAGQIMDRDALLKNLRGVSYDGMDRSVDVAISRLRKKLLDNATEPYRIKTVRNKVTCSPRTPGTINSGMWRWNSCLCGVSRKSQFNLLLIIFKTGVTLDARPERVR